MAVIKLGGVVTGIRGQLAGTLYSANRSGTYARGIAKQPVRLSELQSLQRGSMPVIRSAWANLDPADREDWNTWAALPAQARTNSLGDTYYLSGYNAFMMIQLNLLSCAAAFELAPPTDPVPDPIDIDTLTFADDGGSPSLLLAYQNGEIPATDALVVFAAYDPRGATTAAPSRWLLVASLYNPGATEYECYPRAAALVSTPAPTSQIWCDIIRQAADGQRSAALRLSAFYAP